MQKDKSNLSEGGVVGASINSREGLKWNVKWSLHKFADELGDIARALQAGADVNAFAADEVIEREGNLLMYGGASCMWQGLLGNMTATAGQALTKFDNANAAIGVGDSTTAAAATHTDLQAATNKLRVGMDATYPQHTDGTTSPAATITFRSTFTSGQANWGWQEWGVFNSPTAATGRMLNRKVEALGTKVSGTWTLTVTLTLA